jgi:ABC-type polysaccharide/polyol phosphate export permease
MVVLFTSIFSTMSLIEDRHEGFLQAVLVAPSSRLSVVRGTTLGGGAIALLQAGLVMVALPWAGYPLAQVDWPLTVLLLTLASLALCSLGFAIAWFLDSVQGYHAVMSVLLLPLWIVSGAMFPVERAAPWLGAVMRVNPMTYAVEGLRHALYGGAVPAGLGPGVSAGPALAAVAGFAALSLGLAVWACTRQK